MKVCEILESCLYVSDLDAAETFYKNVLGLEVHSRREDRHVFFRCGERMLLLFNPQATRPSHGTDGPGHLAFAVREHELAPWRSALREHGVRIVREHTWPGGGQSIYFRDPAGNSLELATPATWAIDEARLLGGSE
ncbi:VOC family protein [bacterium]|nr:VOC family protein [bacterium]